MRTYFEYLSIFQHAWFSKYNYDHNIGIADFLTVDNLIRITIIP